MAKDFKTTAQLKVPDKIVDQVIGQEAAVEIIRKAALQRRHVLLIGEPGTGKSMLGLALAELLPREKLVDIMALPNPNDENQPVIRTMPAGKGRDIVQRGRLQATGVFRGTNLVLLVLAVIISLIPYYLYARKIFPFDNPIIYAASMITGMVFVQIGRA